RHLAGVGDRDPPVRATRWTSGGKADVSSASPSCWTVAFSGEKALLHRAAAATAPTPPVRTVRRVGRPGEGRSVTGCLQARLETSGSGRSEWVARVGGGGAPPPGPVAVSARR